MSDPVASRLQALADAALKLARSAPSGQLALARLSEAIDPLWVSDPQGEAFVQEMRRAERDATEPLERGVVERVLRAAWGTAPSRELDELSRDPVAVTPVAQVHRGVLDGEPVAIKVLRPALAGRVRQDLALLDALARPLGAALPGLDPSAMIAEVRERTLEELDLESEAEAQRRVHRALREHPTLHVPAPISRLSDHTVLVTPWLEGVPLAEAGDGERDRAAALYAAFVLGGARFGLVHAAPARLDALLLRDGRVAVLDFGAVRETEPARVAAAADALDALAAEDTGAFTGALGRLGALPADAGAGALALARHALGPFADTGPARLDVHSVLAARDRLAERGEDLARVALALTLPPSDLWPLTGVARVYSTIARAGGATADWLSLARASLRGGWEAARDVGPYLR